MEASPSTVTLSFSLSTPPSLFFSFLFFIPEVSYVSFVFHCFSLYFFFFILLWKLETHKKGWGCFDAGSFLVGWGESPPSPSVKSFFFFFFFLIIILSYKRKNPFKIGYYIHSHRIRKEWLSSNLTHCSLGTCANCLAPKYHQVRVENILSCP